jgi:hypothetical protein
MFINTKGAVSLHLFSRRPGSVLPMVYISLAAWVLFVLIVCTRFS